MTRFDDLPTAARLLWAKSGAGHGHGLLAHMLDVAAVAATVLDHEPPATRAWAAEAFGIAEPDAGKCIPALVGLHDFGKAIPGFEGQWPEGRWSLEKAGLPFLPRSLRVTRHDWASAALLRELLCGRAGNREWVNAVTQAISAHHGYNLGAIEIKDGKPPFEGAEWLTARQALFDAYWDTIVPAGNIADHELPLASVVWLAGLTSFSDWIGSNTDWFTPGERATTFIGHFEAAKRLAAKALAAIGWPVFSPLCSSTFDTDALISRIIGRNSEIKARPLQVTADKLLAGTVGPVLMIVEAPMGEGKTELALLAHLRLQAANQHRGLYIALPTQATGNAMFDRTLGFLRSFAGEIHLDIQLAHGGAAQDERITRLQGIHGERDDNVTSSAWFSQRRRALISPYGVGTIDQALFATLNVKHHFVRLWGLSNRVVVLDEVHAYDTYTSGLIVALLRWLKSLGCSVVLMSATLPEKRRTELLAAWGIAGDATPNLPYPRLLLASEGKLRCETVAARALPAIEVSGIVEDIETIADHALKQLSNGGCGAIVVNTVDRAQRLCQWLRDRIPNNSTLMLFHARYPADERRQREQAVLDCFGQGGIRPARALLIATQVVEQSLDLDFDFLISDLAPIDLLLQRAGRLHRHERTRPEVHRIPRLTVAGLISGRFPEIQETAWEYVYAPYILGRTWALASSEPLWQLPQDIDRLVQRVYDDNVALPDDLDEADRQRIEEGTYGEHRARLQQDALYALHAAIDADAEPQSAYADKPRGNEEGDGLGIRNRTRLGDDSITVVPLLASDSGWRLHPDESPFDPQAPANDTLAHRIYDRQLKLNRKAVVAELGPTEPPHCFAEHPLLRNIKPLLFADGYAQVGGLRLRLDAELGVVYEKSDTLQPTAPAKDAS